ncbi:hypothetical protein FACS189419_08190 [Planctomycetales bacterium]|nr:hypothetical protein FACS189419_08190 [Planctomycetales bacterium]
MERRKLIQAASGGLVAGLLGAHFDKVLANEPVAPIDKETPIDDWHAELTKRITLLDANGGGTLELGDGLYEISKPLRILTSVSLIMTPNAVIKAKAGFEGDAVLIKGGGNKSKYSDTAGWIRGGIIDGNKLPITGIRVENVMRLEIADILVHNALYKGIHLLEGGYEKNLTRVRCDVDLDTRYAPGSIGIHYENADSKVYLAHVIGYETGLRSDSSSNWFNLIHVWNVDEMQGPMLINFYCNGGNNTFNQCYADSPTTAGFYVTAPHQSFLQNRVYYSRWAADVSGVGFQVTPNGKHCNYIGNMLFANNGHRLAKAFDGDLEGATIIATSSSRVVGGLENRIPSGETAAEGIDGGVQYPPLHLSGSGFRLTQQTAAPLPEQGLVGEIRWVDDGESSALWVKTTKGWKKSQLT